MNDVCDTMISGIQRCTSRPARCCDNRYLVTGKFGVTKEKVTWSSMADNSNLYDHTLYHLNSTQAWSARLNGSGEWIQVKIKFTYDI